MAVALSNELRTLKGKDGVGPVAPERIFTVAQPIFQVNQFACVATQAAELEESALEFAGTQHLHGIKGVRRLFRGNGGFKYPH